MSDLPFNAPLPEVLRAVRSRLIKKRIIEDGPSCSPAEIAAAEIRLGHPLPPDIRLFYQTVRPVRVFSPNGPDSFGFYLPDQLRIDRRTDTSPAPQWEHATPAEDWANVTALHIGQSLYGDAIFHITGHRTEPDGSIAIYDHELAMGDEYFSILANSLAEFITNAISPDGLIRLIDNSFDDDDDD